MKRTQNLIFVVILCIVGSCKCKKEDLFIGIVFSTANVPIEGVDVSINGKMSRTDKEGYFKIDVSGVSDSEYKISAHKVGFGLYAKKIPSSVREKRIYLTQGTIIEFDPTQKVTLVDQGIRFPFRPSLLNTDTAKLFAMVPKVYSPQGTLIDLGLPAEISNTFDFLKLPLLPSPGITVTIQPNSLVDAGGQLPQAGTKLTASLSTVDFYNPDGMPGDFLVSSNKEQLMFMESFGAGNIEVYQGEKRYQLRNGGEAELTIPIYPVRLGLKEKLPEIIPVLHYNEGSGLWEQTGEAKLGPGGKTYVTTVKHFSVINTDIVKNVPAKCMKFRQQVAEGPAKDFPDYLANYDVDVIVPASGSQTFTTLPRSVSESSGCIPWNLQNSVGGYSGKITMLNPVVRLPDSYIVYVFKNGTEIRDIAVGLPGTGTLPGGPAASTAAADCSTASGCPPDAAHSSTDCGGVGDPNQDATSTCNVGCWLSQCGFFPFENKTRSLKIVAVPENGLKVLVKWYNRGATTQGVKILECTGSTCTTGGTVVGNYCGGTACDTPGNPTCSGYNEFELTYTAAQAGTVRSYRVEIYSTSACTGTPTAAEKASTQQAVTINN